MNNMRVIKFRAWDGLCMIDWLTICQTAFNRDGRNLLYDIMTRTNSQFILMQYIDLKDELGKEIYEGDIIERWDIMPCCGQKKFLGIFEIIWKDYGFYAHNQEYNILGFANNDKRKIIGNIYEDNHLLK